MPPHRADTMTVILPIEGPRERFGTQSIPMKTSNINLSLVVIQPSRGWVGLRIADVWAYRELLYFLTWREVKVRYKQTALGAAWALIQPLATMVVFSVFFGKLAKIPSDGLPYPLFAFTALVPWMFFSNALSQASSSLVDNTNLLTKVYFPRLTIPISAILSGTVDFVIAFALLLAMLAYYHLTPSWTFVWIPLFFLLAVMTALGAGLWFSALNVQHRDVRYVIPFLTQLWMFATPIAYPSSLLHEPWRTVFGINPMTGVIEGFRWALLGTHTRPTGLLLASALTAVVMLIGGAFYFRKMENTFADII